MSRVQSAVTDQRSEASKDRTCCELEVTCYIHEPTCRKSISHESESRKEVNTCCITHALQHRCMFLHGSKKDVSMCAIIVCCSSNSLGFKKKKGN